MSHLRSATLRGFRSVVAELGGDADALARSVGLSPDVLDTDDDLVPRGRAAALLEVAAEQLDCPNLGLRVAGRQSVSMLGPLAVAMTNSPTIGNALECLSRYLSVYGRFLTLEFGEDPENRPGVVGLYYGPATASGSTQAVDLGIGFIHRAITYLNGGPYGLRGIHLPYRSPVSREDYDAFFGTKVHTGRPHPAAVLRLPAQLPAQELSGVNDTLRQLAVAFLDEQTPETDKDVVARTRTAIRESLGTGTIELAGIARLLYMHPRTLQRRLEDADVAFGRLLDDTRRDVALRLLVGTDLPLGHIAGMVGFQERPSFSRAARRWWGLPPGEVRRTRGLPANR
ncbi:AraC family transcriptional regulator [Nocardia lijiangensis]|uniref:AraC family transcriptional regulator n=1 Tax=Nocardia lijiangensis TaxID=299618 RepID=UPI000835B750|nr:AraC family transcriptional regulator [Nocardia lijiangensis]